MIFTKKIGSPINKGIQSYILYYQVPNKSLTSGQRGIVEGSAVLSLANALQLKKCVWTAAYTRIVVFARNFCLRAHYSS